MVANKAVATLSQLSLTKYDILISNPQETQSDFKLFGFKKKKAILFEHVTRGISYTHGWWLYIKR